MLNRQDSLLSSSRRQTPPPENRRRGKSVGCMSGIFQLLSKYQRRTKRLTSGGKRGKFSEDSSPAVTKAANKKVTSLDDKKNEVTVQRSPALPPELRRGACPENAKARPALVARLMGLEEKCSPAVVTAEFGESLTEVKRKMLLKALDKCNQDLEALKKIIKAVGSSPPASVDGGASTPPAAVETCKQKSTAEHQLILSPISVLDEQIITTRSPPLSKIHDNAIHIVQRSKQAGTDESINCIMKKFTRSSFRTKREAVATYPLMWCSKAMVQSVEEVCRDIASGEQREAGKIGLVLQDYICADLIQELVKDLGSSSPCTVLLPFEACRRRLCL